MSNPEIVDDVQLSFNAETHEVTLTNAGDESVTINLADLLLWLADLLIPQ